MKSCLLKPVSLQFTVARWCYISLLNFYTMPGLINKNQFLLKYLLYAKFRCLIYPHYTPTIQRYAVNLSIPGTWKLLWKVINHIHIQSIAASIWTYRVLELAAAKTGHVKSGPFQTYYLCCFMLLNLRLSIYLLMPTICSSNGETIHQIVRVWPEGD